MLSRVEVYKKQKFSMEGLLNKFVWGKLERDGLRLIQLLRYVVETVDHTFFPEICTTDNLSKTENANNV